MISSIDNYFYLVSNSVYFNKLILKTFYGFYNFDLILNIQLFKNIYVYNNLTILKNISPIFIESVYLNLIDNNMGYFFYTNNVHNFNNYNYAHIYILKIFLKLSIFFFILYTIFFLTNFESYIKQLKTINYLVKLFILNSTEKEVGPVDDYFFFTILFILTISMFIFTSIILILTQVKIFIVTIGCLFLMTFLILSIPINLFIDFGIIFSSVIRGSASSNNFLKELIFDILSFTTVFIRFIVQNIRFLFIFSGVFELLEWCLSIDNSIFCSSIFLNNNLFVNNITLSNFLNISNFNYLFINSLLFIILYFYYLLHLLFLLIVQIVVYVGISVWLFFFFIPLSF